MRKILLLFLLLSSYTLPAQMLRGVVQEDFTMEVETVDMPALLAPREDDFSQLPGFPKRVVANAAFKNFRNVTLADLTNDGKDEILMATNNTLYVYSHDTLLWSKALLGVAIYPPSVADLDKDGDPEIVQCTGGSGQLGRLFAMDHTGQDLPGWPLNFDNNWMLLAPALADVNGDGQLEILANELDAPGGRLHVLRLDGQSYNENFPVSFPNPPAWTPSVGDLNGDGEVEIVTASTRSVFIIGLDGQIKTEINNPDEQRYSYQSPILVDLDNSGKLSVVAAAHGNVPQFFVLNPDGSFRDGWPIPVPDNDWTYSTPSVVRLSNEYTIIGSRPIGETTDDMIFGWNKDGFVPGGFPIAGPGGHEGITAVADVDDDGEMEVIVGSNLQGLDGYGFIHAYNLDGSGEVSGFPLRPRGWTLVNGANVGDVNADGMMDLIVLSFTQNFGNGLDSTYLNVYDLGVPYTPDRVLWSTYKGDNSRSGLLTPAQTTSAQGIQVRPAIDLRILSNPVADRAILLLALEAPGEIRFAVHDALGRMVHADQPKAFGAGTHTIQLPMANLPAGNYWLKVVDVKNQSANTIQVIKK